MCYYWHLRCKKRSGFEKTNLTSLDIISFHKELEKIKKLKIDNVLVEASSHGLNQEDWVVLNSEVAYLQILARIILITTKK